MGQRDSNWIPQNLIESMQFETQMNPGETPDQTHRRLLKESLPYVTMELRNIALNDPDSRVRLQATNTILDRLLGKSGVVADGIEGSASDKLFEGLEKHLQEALEN